MIPPMNQSILHSNLPLYTPALQFIFSPVTQPALIILCSTAAILFQPQRQIRNPRNVTQDPPSSESNFLSSTTGPFFGTFQAEKLLNPCTNPEAWLRGSRREDWGASRQDVSVSVSVRSVVRSREARIYTHACLQCRHWKPSKYYIFLPCFLS